MSTQVRTSLNCLDWYIYRLPKDQVLEVTAHLTAQAVGPWAVTNVPYQTLAVFYIKEKRDAMMFKLMYMTLKPKFRG